MPSGDRSGIWAGGSGFGGDCAMLYTALKNGWKVPEIALERGLEPIVEGLLTGKIREKDEQGNETVRKISFRDRVMAQKVVAMCHGQNIQVALAMLNKLAPDKHSLLIEGEPDERLRVIEDNDWYDNKGRLEQQPSPNGNGKPHDD